MPYIKGQSGNPAGRPVGVKPIRGGVIAELVERFGNMESGARAIGRALVGIALDEDHPKQINALQEVFDRIDGKAKETVELDATVKQEFTPLTEADKELLNRYLKGKKK